jgi:hypothetical protein
MEKLATLFEVSSSEFRTKIKTLGHIEKGSELTSGGEINPDFLNILTKLLEEWEKVNPNCNLKFTSGNDKFHKGITSYTSRHTKGEAVDVTLDQPCRSAFISLLNTYKSKYNGFSFIDEYTNPTAKATGGHFHMSYRSGAPEGGGKSGGNTTTTTTPVSGSTETPVAGSTETPVTGDYASKASSIFDDALKTGLSKVMSMGESRLERDINKIKKLLK